MAGRLHNSILRDLVEPAGIGPVRCEELEILRRIFVTVRDRNWQEIAPTHWSSVIDEQNRSATLMARHTSDLVDFEWQGDLSVSEDARDVRFAFEGRVFRDMEVCRLGLVVLHPVDSIVDARLTAVGPHVEESLTVAGTIAPQPIINGAPGAIAEPFLELRIERADFGLLVLRFGGEFFELEDQRNWGDASFKTYCTPLRLGFPRAIQAGTRVAQSVKMHFTPAAVVGGVKAKARRPGLHGGRSGRFPALGRQMCPLESATTSGKDKLPWDHLHIEAPSAPDLGPLGALLDAAPPKLHIGLTVETEEDPSAEVLAWLRDRKSRTARLLFYGAGAALPAAAAVDRWRRRLEMPGSPQIPTLAATRGYFVEFNRAVPFEARVAGLAFPLSATVHSDDAATIADNVATIADIALTARRLTRCSQLALAPLALYYPAPAQAHFPSALIAPWLTATLIHSAQAQITSITLASDIVAALAAPFLSRLIECAGLEVWPFEGHSAGVHAIALGDARETPTRLLLCNLASRPRMLSLADTGLQATEAIEVVNGMAILVSREGLELPPYSVVWTALVVG